MDLTLLIAIFAIAGAMLGFAADRLSVRWPAHQPGYQPRGLDWRAIVLVATGAVVFGGLVVRWEDDPRSLILLGIVAGALVVLLATDLDQKILPDLITLPLIGLTAAILLLGWSPLLAGKELGVVSGIAGGVVAPAFLFITDRLLRGDLGDGDLKLALGMGMLNGLSLLVTGLLAASIGFSAVLLLLIATRRISLRSAVPFGPVLIATAFVAMLIG
ncbi:MAG: prepilin peptidase [Candidatus Limnocylindrales bacterium]